MQDVCHPKCDSKTVYLQLSAPLNPISLLSSSVVRCWPPKALHQPHNYSTEYTKCLHIDFAKYTFATNKKDEYPQKTMWLEHQEKPWHHAIYIQWRLDGEPNISQQLEEVTPCLSLTKQPSCNGVHISQLIQDYGATDFQ